MPSRAPRTLGRGLYSPVFVLLGRYERTLYLFWRIRIPLWLALAVSGWALFDILGLVGGCVGRTSSRAAGRFYAGVGLASPARFEGPPRSRSHLGARQDGGMLIRHRGSAPVVDGTAFVAPTATLVGDVRIGPRARVMYGAVLDAEASRVIVGEACVITENAVLRATAAGDADRPVVLGDHVFVGPHATLLGCTLARCVYIGTGATVLHGATLAAGAVIAVGALVHARTSVPSELFVPPHSLAIGAPARILTPDQSDKVATAIREANFAGAAFGVQVDWNDRIARYEQSAEVRVAEFGAHRDDEILA